MFEGITFILKLQVITLNSPDPGSRVKNKRNNNLFSHIFMVPFFKKAFLR